MRSTRPILILGLLLTIFSCKKQTEELQTEPLSDYAPLVVGKSITYRVDSTVLSNFGRTIEIHKYQIKHVVEAQVEDNLGRPSYRVFRYLRDSAGTSPWQPNGSYLVTPQDNVLEVIEDNLRVIKLHEPLRDGYTWKGNTYLPTEPYADNFNFNNDDNMDRWNFTYDGSAAPFSYDGNDYTDVFSVEEIDETYNYPNMDPDSYSFHNRSVERYSKNIGLVYREYTLWEYQPNTNGTGGPYNTGFGMTMWMIDHN